ncbi:hypothetical protein P4E94_00505 [Pontiellaceae bacterium B12219]|nr:hypothetical protein [Pontiellaceae bacterium B12219]
MNAVILYSIPCAMLLLSLSAKAEELDLDLLMQQSEIKQSVRARSESTLLESSVALEQVRAQAKGRSDYGLEFRPRISDSNVGAALRIYLPSSWNKSALQQQLALVAQTEQLRVAALEWVELMEVYRLFCEYRLCKAQDALLADEREFLEPYLEQANEAVALNRLKVTERAKLYSHCLDLINNQEKVRADQLDVEKQLLFLVGAEADLDAMAEIAKVEMPSEMEFATLMQQALKNRSDYRQFQMNAQALDAAAQVARKEEGFRLKYIQPDYQVDYNDGESSFGLTASIVLPWGTKNPDIQVYQHQRELEFANMNLYQTQIADRLRVLLKTAEAYYTQSNTRDEIIEPLLAQLALDMKDIDTGRLAELRDLIEIRERILDASLQTAEATARNEEIAVDLVAELGSF